MDQAHVLMFNWVMLGVQVLGLGSAWLTRRSEGSPLQSTIQALFVVALVLVGVATIVAIGRGPGCWLACGTTLSLMVVGVVCEFDRRPETDELA
jgi:hypothetical protein